MLPVQVIAALPKKTDGKPYWVFELPDGAAAWVFADQFALQRWQKHPVLVSLLRAMPIGCIVRPPMPVEIEVRENKGGYLRVSKLETGPERQRFAVPFDHNIKPVRRLLRGSRLRCHDRDFAHLDDAIAYALQTDGYAYPR